MQYTSKTIERGVVGRFTGKRFPSMSDDVVDALLTVEYRFENFTITVAGIPARWDRTTGAEYVTGKVGREIHERLTILVAMLEKRSTKSLQMETVLHPLDTELLQLERRPGPLEEVTQSAGRVNRARMIAEILRVTPLHLSLNLPRAA